jgi:CubicO group peptidase (beta-lactamase class C family)
MMTMKSLLRFLLLWITALPLFALGPAAAVSGTPDPLAVLFGKDQGETRGVLMIHKGKVVHKRLAPGYTDQTRFISWSMAKSLTAMLVGELVSDGVLRPDDSVTFSEWQKPGDPRGAITLDHLLHMSSGLDHTEGFNPKDGGGAVRHSDMLMTLFLDGAPAMAARGLSRPLEAKPGTKFEYSSVTSLMLSELITRRLTPSKDPVARARAYTDFAQERLFKPAGITSARMDFDGSGTQIGGSIIYMTLDDWGRFGRVLLTGKGEDGQQVIAPDWLRFMRTASATDTSYGGHVWLNTPRSDGAAPALFPGKGPASLYSAVGHLGQYVIASPEQDLVLVRLGKTNDGDLAPVRAALGDVVAAIPLNNPKRTTP